MFNITESGFLSLIPSCLPQCIILFYSPQPLRNLQKLSVNMLEGPDPKLNLKNFCPNQNKKTEGHHTLEMCDAHPAPTVFYINPRTGGVLTCGRCADLQRVRIRRCHICQHWRASLFLAGSDFAPQIPSTTCPTSSAWYSSCATSMSVCVALYYNLEFSFLMRSSTLLLWENSIACVETWNSSRENFILLHDVFSAITLPLGFTRDGNIQILHVVMSSDKAKKSHTD